MSLAARLRALLALSLLFIAIDVHATCTATTQDVLSVGDKSKDSACNYDNIQDAIDASTCATGTRIYVTSELEYTAEHLTISNKNVSLIGRGANGRCGGLVAVCGTLFPCPTTPQATISGSGHTGDSVITIRGASNVNLQYLTITGGHDSDSGSGGGIDYQGTGILNLDTSSVSDNTAGYGGGININGAGGNAQLHINANTLVIGNTATTSGGGIRVEGQGRLYMVSAQTTVALNHAKGGYGGGIEVVSPGRAFIGSPGYAGLAAVYGNDAMYGGGIAMATNTGEAPDPPDVYLFTTDPNKPVGVFDNTATKAGGGIYLKPSSGNFHHPTFCAYDFRINENIAQEGTAIYADEDNDVLGYYDSSVGLNQVADGNSRCSAAGASSLGAVRCAAGVACNEIHDNVALDVANSAQPTDGAAILMQTEASFDANRVDFRGNKGGYVMRTVGDSNDIANYTNIGECLIADNIVTHELIHAGNANNVMAITDCTFAHNQIPALISNAANHALHMEGKFTLTNSIINESGIAALAFFGSAANLAAQYIVADNPDGLPADPTIMAQAPTFISVANGDYRLLASRQGSVVSASWGIDYAPAISGDDRDIRNQPYDQDISNIGNRFGVRDIGAYEMQAIGDRIFGDYFGDPILLAQ